MHPLTRPQALPSARITWPIRAAITLAILAYAVYVVGCSSDPGQSSPPLQGVLHGTYFSHSDNPVSEITFIDDTHYSLLKSGCAGEQVDGEGDVGCTETGTYSLDTVLGQLSLTDGATDVTTTMPFQIDATQSGGGVDTLALTTGPGGGLANPGGNLTTAGSGSGSLIQCYSSVAQAGTTSSSYGLSCASATGSSSGSGSASADGVIARAELWVAAALPYCQAANHQADSDKSCASTCNRPNEPAEWDPYRSDCSGFVSWAWGLPPPGRTTTQFGDITKSIQGSELQAGDALLAAGKHIILFIQWSDGGHTSAILQEEPGCSAKPPSAHQFTASVTISGSQVKVEGKSESFNAIRYNKMCASSCGGPGQPTGGH